MENLTGAAALKYRETSFASKVVPSSAIIYPPLTESPLITVTL